MEIAVFINSNRFFTRCYDEFCFWFVIWSHVFYLQTSVGFQHDAADEVFRCHRMLYASNLY